MKRRFQDRVLLRNTADIRRLAIRVATRWTLPHVEISTDRFAKVTAQRMQERIARLGQACNCILGEVLGGTVLVVGFCKVWVTSGTWRDVGWVLLIAVDVAIAGKVVEFAWTRLRLLWALAALRRRLDAPDASPSNIPREFAKAEAAWQARREMPRDEPAPAQAPRARRQRRPRPKVLLRDARDIRHLCLRLATRWTAPRIEIDIEGLPARDEQRAQHRYVRLTDSASFMSAAVLATLTMLGGLLYVVWTQAPEWDTSNAEDWWLQGLGWSDVQPVLFATLAAGLAGFLGERTWTRVRLIRVLVQLRKSALIAAARAAARPGA